MIHHSLDFISFITRRMSIWWYPDISIKSKQTAEERKLALTDHVSFVLVYPYYLTLVLSISPNVLSPHLCSFYLFQTLRQSADFPLSPTSPFLLGARGQSLLSYRNLSCASSIFPKSISLPLGRGNRPNADAAGAQPAEIASAIPPGTSVHRLHLQSETLPRRGN